MVNAGSMRGRKGGRVVEAGAGGEGKREEWWKQEAGGEGKEELLEEAGGWRGKKGGLVVGSPLTGAALVYKTARSWKLFSELLSS